MRGRQTRGRQTVSVNSVIEQWSSNSGRPKRGRQTRGRQTVSVNSVSEQCRPTVVVQKGSSNKGSSNSVSEQWSPNRGRPIGVVSEQWPPNSGQLVKTDCA